MQYYLLSIDNIANDNAIIPHTTPLACLHEASIIMPFKRREQNTQGHTL